MKLPNNEEMKYEIAKELGLEDKLAKGGWKSLTASETGRIGGLINHKNKRYFKKKNDKSNNLY